MTRDTKPARDIKKDKHAYDKQQKKKHNDDDNEETSSSDNEDDGMNEHEYRKFLSKIFPSKHLDNKIKAGERLKSKLKPNSSKKEEESEEEESEYAEEVDGEWETASEEEDIPRTKKPGKNSEFDEKHKNSIKGSNVNITFTIGGIGKDEDSYDEDYDDEDEDEDESVSETENEDDSVSTDSSSQAEEESENEDEDEDEDDDEEDAIYTRTRNKSSMRKNAEPQIKSNPKPKISKKEKETKMEVDTDNSVIPQATQSSNDIVAKLKELLEQNKNNKMAQKCIDMCEDEIATNKKKQDKKLAKTKAKNLRIFKRKVSDKNVMNDFAFYSKLDIDEQRAIIKELREVNKITQHLHNLHFCVI